MPSRLPLQTPASIEEFLKNCPTLAPLITSELAAQFQVKQYPRGHVFFRGSDKPSTSLWVVVWGRVEVHSRKTRAPRLCGAHSSFGEESIISGTREMPKSTGLQTRLQALLSRPTGPKLRNAPFRFVEARAVALESTVVLELSAKGVDLLRKAGKARLHLRRANAIHRIAPQLVAALAATRAFANVSTDNLYQLLSGAERVPLPNTTKPVLKLDETPKDYFVLLEGTLQFVFPQGSAQSEQLLPVKHGAAPLVVGADELLAGTRLRQDVFYISGGQLLRLSGETLRRLRENDRGFAQSLLRLDGATPGTTERKPPTGREILVLMPCNADEWSKRRRELRGMVDLLAEQMAAQLCARVLVLHLLLPKDEPPSKRPLLVPVDPAPIGFAPEGHFDIHEEHGALKLWVEYRYLEVDPNKGVPTSLFEELQRAGEGGPPDFTLIDVPPLSGATVEQEDRLYGTLREFAGHFRLVSLLNRPSDLPPSSLLGREIDMVPTAVLESRPMGGIGPQVSEVVDWFREKKPGASTPGRKLPELVRNLGALARASAQFVHGAGEELISSTEQLFPKLAERIHGWGRPDDEASGTLYQPWPMGTVRIHLTKSLLDAVDKAPEPTRLAGLSLPKTELPAVRQTFGHWARGATGSSVGLALGGGGPYGKVHPLLIQQLLRGGVPIDMISGSSVGATVGAYYAVFGEPGLEQFDEDVTSIGIAALFGILSSAFIEALLLVELGFVRLERSEIPFFPVVTDADTGIESDVRHGTYASGVRASGSLPPVGPTVLGDRRFLDGGLVANVPIGVLRLESAAVVIASNCISTIQARGRRAPLPIPVLGKLLLESNPWLRVEDALRMIPLIFQTTGKAQDTQADVVFTANENANLNASDLNQAVSDAQLRVRALLRQKPPRVHLDSKGKLQVHGAIDFEPGTAVLQAHTRLVLNDLADFLHGKPAVEGTVLAFVPGSPGLGGKRAEAILKYLKSRHQLRQENLAAGELSTPTSAVREEVRFELALSADATPEEKLLRQIFREKTQRMQAESLARARGLLLTTEAQLSHGEHDLARLLAMEAAAYDRGAATDRVLRLVLSRRGRPLGQWNGVSGADRREVSHTDEGDDIRAVSLAVFSPDGRYLATGSTDGIVRVWDMGEARHGHALRKVGEIDHRGTADPGIRGVAWSRAPEATPLLATTGFDATVQLHEVHDDGLRFVGGTQLGTWDQWGVAFSPDGEQLLSQVGGTASLVAWPMDASRSKEPLEPWQAPDPSDSVRHAAWSADGRLVAVGTELGVVSVWKPGTAESVTVGAQRGRVFRVAWHPVPGRKVLAVASASALCLYVHEDDAGPWKKKELEGKGPWRHVTRTDHQGRVRDVTWSPDGTQLLSAGEDGTAFLWDVVPGGLTRWRGLHAGDEPLTGAAWHADGGSIVTWGASGSADVWNARTGHRLASLSGHNGAVLLSTWRPGSDELLTASEDGLLRRWDPTFCGQVSFTEHRRGLECVAWHPKDEALALSAGLDGAVHLWNPRTGERLHALLDMTGAPGPAWAAWSPDGQWLAAMQRGASGPSFFQASDGTRRGAVPTVEAADSGLESRSSAGPQLAFSPDGRWLAVRHAKQVSLWDVASGERLGTAEAPGGCGVVALAWHPGSSQLAFSTWSAGAAVHLLDLDAAGSGQVRTLGFHSDGVWCLAYSADGRWLATGCNDSHLRVFDPSSGTLLAELKHARAVKTAAWRPRATAGASLLAIGDMTQVVSAMLHVTEAPDTEGLTLTHLHRLETHFEESRDLVWSPDGKRLASAGGRGRVYLWSAAEHSAGTVWSVEATLRGHPSGVRSVAFSADGAWLLSGGDDGQALVHPVGFDTLVSAVSALPGRKTLTHEERRLYVPAFPTSGEANQPAVK